MGILLSNGCSFTYGDELEGSRQGFFADGTLKPAIHHHRTFTHKLADKLGVKYINMGQNGSSNQKIFRRTTTFLQTTSKKVDYVVLTWSSWGRVEVFLDKISKYEKSLYLGFENNMNQIIPDHHEGKLKFLLNVWRSKAEFDEKDIAAKAWFENVYNFQTAIIHHLNYMCIMQQLCDSLGIKIVQGIIHHGMWSNVIATIRHGHKTKYDMQEYVDTISNYLRYLRPECKIGLGDKKDLTSIAEDNENCKIHRFKHPCENTHTYYADMLYDIIQGL